ncbi:hypothetical protein K2173_002454 [Erythroxylum novogranatense]|uniref:DUF7798 domain-containing protein n=1 Tax=Erythroxylum novogranatense TaxID=1862640 RepID=A0AAV8T9S1_9ROSI|nr:hypothetical protein K2173_002454 [Erythroxylum novogranatense]
MEENSSPPKTEGHTTHQQQEQQRTEQNVEPEQKPQPPVSGGGWGGWGFSSFSVLSDFQKAAGEISRSAAVAAEKAAKSIADMQIAEDSESSKGEDERQESSSNEESGDQDEKKRKSALDNLEKASEDSILGQGLKALDHSVENFASGAWQALGSALRGGSSFVQKLEHSAANLAESIQQGGLPGATGSVAPSILETGKAFTTKGMQVLEYVGKETMDLLITETGIEVERISVGSAIDADEDQLLEDVTFDRCFYIYGGPEQLEELEALSNHYALLFNRRKAKLPMDQKSAYDGKLKLIQQIFSCGEMNLKDAEFDKGKTIEMGAEGSSDEVKTLHDASVSKAADMTAGFTSALAGPNMNDVIQRTAGKLETLHSEGVHRISEMCCSAVTRLLMLGKSIISSANKIQEEDGDWDIVNIDWPEDSFEKAKIIRTKAQSITGYVEAVSNSFITAISDVAEAYAAALKGATAESPIELPQAQASIEEKAKALSENLRADRTTAAAKIQDGLQYLTYVVIFTSMATA